MYKRRRTLLYVQYTISVSSVPVTLECGTGMRANGIHNRKDAQSLAPNLPNPIPIPIRIPES